MSEQGSRSERRERAREARLEAQRSAAAQDARRRRLQILGVVAAVVLIAIGVIVVATGGGDSGEPPSDVQGVADTTALFKGVPLSANVAGDPDAPVTLVEYVDLQCPICKQYSEQLVPRVIDDYVKTGKVRYEIRVASILGPDSTTAQFFASSTQLQDRVWPFAEIFYANQGDENSGYVTEDFLRRIASATPGLDVDEAFSAQDGADVTRIVTAVNARGIDSTPTFTIGTSGGSQREIDISADGPQAVIDALERATR